jgi:hypothetical protein
VKTGPQVRRRALGAEGLGWVRRSLARGHDISAQAIAKLDLNSGEVYGYYPQTATSFDPDRFERTLFSPHGTFPAELARISEDAVLQLARSIGGGLLVVESSVPPDHLEDLRGEWLESVLPRSRAVTTTTVLFWRPLQEGSLDDMASYLAAAGEYENAFVLELPKDRQLASPAQLLKVNNLPNAIRGTRGILVPAYDSETYVLWTSRLNDVGSEVS